MSLNYLEADDYNTLVARFGLPMEEAYVEHTGKQKDKPKKNRQQKVAEAGLPGTIGAEDHGQRRQRHHFRVSPRLEVLNLHSGQHDGSFRSAHIMQRIARRKHWAAGTVLAESTGFIFHQDAAGFGACRPQERWLR